MVGSFPTCLAHSFICIRRFLGPRMIYTSGIVLNPHVHESLETLQDNKLAVVCSKLGLKSTDRCVSSPFSRIYHFIIITIFNFCHQTTSCEQLNRLQAPRRRLWMGHPRHLRSQELWVRRYWCYAWEEPGKVWNGQDCEEWGQHLSTVFHIHRRYVPMTFSFGTS